MVVMLTSVAREAHELSGIAEEKSRAGGDEAFQAHSNAAVKYMDVARRLRDPATKRAFALIGHEHARRAACFYRTNGLSASGVAEEGGDEKEQQPSSPRVSAIPAEKHRSEEYIKEQLAIPDFNDLKERLNDLGVKGRNRPLKSPSIPQVRGPGDEKAEALLSQQLGRLSPVADEDETDGADVPRYLSARVHALSQEVTENEKARKGLCDENAKLRRERELLSSELELYQDFYRDREEFIKDFAKHHERVQNQLVEFRKQFSTKTNQSMTRGGGQSEHSPHAENHKPFKELHIFRKLENELKKARDELQRDREMTRARNERLYTFIRNLAARYKLSSKDTDILLAQMSSANRPAFTTRQQHPKKKDKSSKPSSQRGPQQTSQDDSPAATETPVARPSRTRANSNLGS